MSAKIYAMLFIYELWLLIRQSHICRHTMESHATHNPNPFDSWRLCIFLGAFSSRRAKSDSKIIHWRPLFSVANSNYLGFCEEYYTTVRRMCAPSVCIVIRTIVCIIMIKENAWLFDFAIETLTQSVSPLNERKKKQCLCSTLYSCPLNLPIGIGRNERQNTRFFLLPTLCTSNRVLCMAVHGMGQRQATFK